MVLFDFFRTECWNFVYVYKTHRYQTYLYGYSDTAFRKYIISQETSILLKTATYPLIVQLISFHWRTMMFLNI